MCGNSHKSYFSSGSKTSVAKCRPLPKCRYRHFGECQSGSAFDWHLDCLEVLTDIDGCPNANQMPIQIGIHPKCRYRHFGSGRHLVTEVSDPGPTFDQKVISPFEQMLVSLDAQVQMRRVTTFFTLTLREGFKNKF